MTHDGAAEANVQAQRPRSDLVGIAYIGTIGVVMLAWISGLVWATMAFFNWLVS